MFCLACTMPCREDLCASCRIGLRAAPEVTVGGGLVGVAGYQHEGTARRLVHALKYRAVVAAAGPLADAMAERLPSAATALVPIPRARLRAFRYGVDPAALLAAAVAQRTGLTVVDGVRPRWWWRRHAGRARWERSLISFAATEEPVPRGAALVDDVLTTGATARAAAVALRGLPTLVLVATCASRVEQGVGPSGGVVAVSPSSGRIDRTTLRARMIDTAGSTRPDGPTRGHVCHGEEHE
jgi:predicted amidophosphoribosyltransferase